jgi:hypothetical protein
MNSIICTKVEVHFKHDPDANFEVIMELPTNKDHIISNLKIKIGDKEVGGEVKPKDKAKDKYEDAFAKGDFSAYMQYKEDSDEVLLFALGNIIQNQTIEVTYEIIEQA